MKKTVITILLSTLFIVSEAQIKMHSNGLLSFQSLTSSGGVQIDAAGKSCFEPNITTSYTPLTQTKALSQFVTAWIVRFEGTPEPNVKTRFYVTGMGNAFSAGYYSVEGGGTNSKGSYPIENASELISNLNGYYYDNNEWEGFEPDFIDNPNVAPEAVEGLMKDLAINKSLGLSTSDLEAILPEAIRHSPEGMVYINYAAIVPVLVEAFKEQQQQLELLRKVLEEKGLLDTKDLKP